LTPKDYFNFKFTSSAVNKTLNQNYKTLISQYKKIITEKNIKINEQNNDPFYGFIINSENSIIESLLKDYLQSKKIAGVSLKNNIEEDLKFLEYDVIKPLGITMPKSENSYNRSSIFGS